MKKIYVIVAVSTAASVTFTGCKTNEANYKAAYEIAKEKQLKAEDDGPTARLQTFVAPKETIIDGVHLMMTTEPVGFIADGGITKAEMQKYNVIVGRFRQVFNARQMRERLSESGYEKAGVVGTRDSGYYVIAESCATAAEAQKGIKRVNADASLSLRAPLPFVLRPAHLAH